MARGRCRRWSCASRTPGSPDARVTRAAQRDGPAERRRCQRGGCRAAGLCREAASPPPDRQCRRHTHRPGAPASRRHPHLMSVDGPSWAIDMLRTARVGRLATANRTGQPLVVPVCFALVDDSIYSAVDLKPKRTRELRRVRNVRENPQVSLVVDEYDEDWTKLRWVMVESTARVADGAERARALGALVAKYPQSAAMELAA